MTDEEEMEGNDLRIGVLVDQIEAIEAQMKVWRPSAKLIIPSLALFLFYASPGMRSGIPLWLWVFMGVALLLYPWLYLGFAAARYHALDKRRSKLLEVLRGWDQSRDRSLPEQTDEPSGGR